MVDGGGGRAPVSGGGGREAAGGREVARGSGGGVDAEGGGHVGRGGGRGTGSPVGSASMAERRLAKTKEAASAAAGAGRSSGPVSEDTGARAGEDTGAGERAPRYAAPPGATAGTASGGCAMGESACAECQRPARPRLWLREAVDRRRRTRPCVSGISPWGARDTRGPSPRPSVEGAGGSEEAHGRGRRDEAKAAAACGPGRPGGGCGAASPGTPAVERPQAEGPGGKDAAHPVVEEDPCWRGAGVSEISGTTTPRYTLSETRQPGAGEPGKTFLQAKRRRVMTSPRTGIMLETAYCIVSAPSKAANGASAILSKRGFFFFFF
jgi:hypothetical protein